ncbi:hypothetical protein SAMN04487977_11155 [Treponema bryantii]|uniref:Capsule assembly protein Wzi n=1 Tax=Treponema bryantii TaxID=163 RepID=A0A1H9J357_9SPIR|nr:hypothetical protein [Treponema bryantii]SEQ81208.1 hypothetical protein SAMN04487977_11155 [Treponema bryantii]
MKKITVLFASIVLLGFSAFAQTNATVSVTDEIYELLDVAQKKGLCSPLNSYKPYSKSQILNCLREIYDNSEKMSEQEIKIIEQYLAKYEPSEKERKNDFFNASIKNSNENFPVTFNYKSEFEFVYSGGLYTDSDYNSWGMDNMYKINFEGDLGKGLSYRLKGVLDFSKMPLMQVGDYFIGYPWYDEEVINFLLGYHKPDDSEYDVSAKKRYIHRYLNNSYLPYSYKKPWSGQFYFAKNMSASGLEGWATSFGMGFSIDGEIRSSFFNNNIIIGAGRYDREIAAMDNGSSLVLNKQAYPFMAVDAQFKLFNFLKFYSLTGILEYPNQDYINEEELQLIGNPANLDDSYMYQNAFSLNMIELDLKRLHLDFGCSVIWPKRFEIGYIFPLANYVEYQNHIGDCDNLALFGDFKYTIAGLGSVWASFYLDEINGLNNNPFIYTRAMFAYQGGIKYILPKLTFASLSFRYTKIEPYCYTHHSINYAPWYSHYICENYSNNGESLGYYLPPNSDEFLLQFKIKPSANSNAGASYQLIRHGADYGTQQVPGSNIYSELSNKNRDELKKYFLHDGAYNWIHIVSAGGRVSLNTRWPLSFYGNLGLMFSYFTVIDQDKYNRDDYGNNGNCRDVDFTTPFDIADTDEYPTMFGAILTVGVSINF